MSSKLPKRKRYSQELRDSFCLCETASRTRPCLVCSFSFKPNWTQLALDMFPTRQIKFLLPEIMTYVRDNAFFGVSVFEPEDIAWLGTMEAGGDGGDPRKSLDIGRFFNHLQVYCWVKTYPFWFDDEQWMMRIDFFGGTGWADSFLVITCRDKPGRFANLRFFEFRSFCRMDELPTIADEAREPRSRFRGLVRRDIKNDRPAQADFVGYVRQPSISRPSISQASKSFTSKSFDSRSQSKTIPRRWEDIPKATRRTRTAPASKAGKRGSIVSISKAKRRSPAVADLQGARWAEAVLLDADSEDEENGNQDLRPEFRTPTAENDSREPEKLKRLATGRGTNVRLQRWETKAQDSGEKRTLRSLEKELAEEKRKNQILEASNCALFSKIVELHERLDEVSTKKRRRREAELGKLNYW